VAEIIEVRWPGGDIQQIKSVVADRIVEVIEPGKPQAKP
jgi:hypothetical protein